MSAPSYTSLGKYVPKTNGTAGSSVVPQPSDLLVAEIATNSFTGDAFLKKEDGTVVNLVTSKKNTLSSTIAMNGVQSAGSSSLYAAADHVHPSDTSRVPNSYIGSANGVCPLGADSKVPSQYLPSYVDDVLEYASVAAFPATGETGKIYVDTSSNTPYRWTGSVYVAIVSGGAPTGSAGGDLSGTFPNPTIGKLQGKSLSITSPTDGQVLKFNGTTQTWYNGTDASGISSTSGDVTSVVTAGNAAATVVALRSKALAATAPVNSQAYVWNNANNQFEPATIIKESDVVFGGTY